MDLARAFSELKSLPDVALKKELASPTGAIPGYMVIGELHERKTMRAGAGKSPDETIKRKSMAEEYMGDIKSMMPMTMQGMQPPQAMPQQAVPPPQTASPMGGGIASVPQQPQGYAGGGIVNLQQSYPVNQSYREQPQAMLAPPQVQDPEWDWVRETMANKPRLFNVPFPNEAPIPASRPLEPGMTYEDLLALSAADYPWLPSGNDAPIPPQFPPQRHAQGGIVSLAGGGAVNNEIVDYARSEAIRLGLDPEIVLRVIKSEGGFSDPFQQGRAMLKYGREQSYGPLQLHIRQGGLGTRALAAGIDPRVDWKGGVTFGLTEAKNRGWGQWYGAAKAGIGDWEGINGRGGGVYPTGGAAIDPTSNVTADPNAAVATQAAETAGSMAATESAAAPAAAGDPISQYLLMQQLFAQAQPQVAQPQLQAPVVARPQQDYREVAEETSMRPDFYRRQRSYG